MATELRVLQVLADTDDSVATRRGVSLHAALADAGLEVRTVALAPGRRGEHAALLPVVAPARRTLAALTELRTESRWADVVIFHGPRALPPGWRLLRSVPPALLARSDAERQRGTPRPGRVARTGRVRTLVIDPDDEPGTAAWLDLLHGLVTR